jgi:ATP-binding protein involved in chromosome partitioning
MNQQIEKKKLPNIKNIIIVVSGKGGVGKSTVAAGAAMSLAGEGYKTGLLDADIFGPSVPLLFDLQDAKPDVEVRDGKQCILPFEKYGVKLMSIGFFVDTKQALTWRGPRVSSGISQLLSDTYWGELDYLIVDTPPGTGDVHITLLQNFVTSGAIVVTTPQRMALADVKKAVSMFNDPQIGIPILGIVENMVWFSPTAHPNEKYFLFGKGGGQSLANEFNLPLVAQIPFNEKMGESCDAGKVEELLTDKSIKAAFDLLFNGIISK